MQHEKQALKNRVVVGFMAMVWVTGLILAGSDGPLMPYLNIWGGFQFFAASCLLGRVLPRLDSHPRTGMHHGSQGGALGVLPPCRPSVKPRRVLRKIHHARGLQPRYARELGIV